MFEVDAMKPLLGVQDLKKTFPVSMGLWGGRGEGIRAVDGINLNIFPGETLALVGESGSGKSTAARCIVRLIEPTEGRIWFDGQDLCRMSQKALRPLRKRIQIIFQDPYSSLNPRMTIGEAIGDTLRYDDKMTPLDRKKRVFDMMERVGLRPEHYDRYPHEFSGGQRQRIGIARAIAPTPQLIVADEPLSALDVSIQAQVVNLLERLKEEFRLSYLFISHDLSVVEHLSDRVAVMYLGRIVEIASRRDLYDSPRHPYTMALLSAVPIPRVGEKKERIILRGDVPSPLHPPEGCRFHPRCLHAMDICSCSEPPWKDMADGHATACHLY
jgi:oligopeptide/dipeptide ABC transporter ATP-binding protein